MADTRQGGTLADTHEGKPGLPRGRSRLSVVAVRASQGERLVRPALEDTIVSLHLAIMAGRRWEVPRLRAPCA